MKPTLLAAVVLLSCTGFATAASGVQGSGEPAATTMRRVKIFEVWATNRYTGRTICVYSGYCKRTAKLQEDIWDCRPGWRARLKRRRL